MNVFVEFPELVCTSTYPTVKLGDFLSTRSILLLNFPFLSTSTSNVNNPLLSKIIFLADAFASVFHNNVLSISPILELVASTENIIGNELICRLSLSHLLL